MSFSSSLLLSLIQHNIDVSLLVFQHLIDLSDLENVSVVCKASNHVLNNTDQGRQLWLNLGIQATAGGLEGYNEQQIRQRFQQQVHHERQAFFWNLRLLVCPWHSTGRVLPVELRDPHHFSEVIFFTDKDETRLQMQGRTDGIAASKFPARLASSIIAPRVNDDDDEFDAAERAFVEQIQPAEWKDPEPVVFNTELEQQVIAKKVVPDFSHERGCTYRYFPIHAGTFAVVESFSPFFDNDELSDHGVYFISHLTKRVLRHIKIGDALDVQQFYILTRPCEMWMLTFGTLAYYGPSSCAARPDDEWEYEQMDEALWMAGRGNARGAIDYLRLHEIPLHHPSLISSRTVLHYAAKEGHAEAVRELLRAGFSGVNSTDDFGHTALFLAVSELHLDVVEVLLMEGNADPLAGEPCLSNVGEFVQFRPYSVLAERTTDEIKRIVPSIVRLLIEKDRGVIDRSDDHYYQASILSSPEAVRLLCQAGCKPTLSEACCRFGSFRNRVQELSAIQTLYMLVREFGIDINYIDTCVWSNREPVVASLAKDAISEAVIMSIDFLGADPTAKDKDGRTLRQIVQERITRRPADPEGQRILNFLNSRGL